MSLVRDALKTHPICYVTRDIERAMGIPLGTEGYVVVTNKTKYAKEVATDKKNVVLIEEERALDTWELLKKFGKMLPSIPPLLEGGQGGVLIFKNTSQIEKICQENNWKLLNPPALLASRVEEKISQIEWLGALTKYLPPFQLLTCRDVIYKDEPFILQFNRAHTGTGTMFVQSKKDLEDIQNKFPDRHVRMTTYIDGPVFTVNAVVATDAIHVGNISYQITGLAPFTDQPFATIGNDWALPLHLLSHEQRENIKKIAIEIGQKLREDNWKGLFGIDVIAEKKTGQLANWPTHNIFLMEINARQPASSVFESQLQLKNQESPPNADQPRAEKIMNQGTIFEAHLAALLDLPLSEYGLIPIIDGAQVVQRVLKNQESPPNADQPRAEKIMNQGFTVISYHNTTPGSDWLRIQSAHGFMKDHGILNDRGKKIEEMLKKFEQ